MTAQSPSASSCLQRDAGRTFVTAHYPHCNSSSPSVLVFTPIISTLVETLLFPLFWQKIWCRCQTRHHSLWSVTALFITLFLQVLNAPSAICHYLDDNSCSALIILGFVMMSPLVVVAAAIFCELLRKFRLLLLIQPLKRARYRSPLLDWTGGVHAWVWAARGAPGVGGGGEEGIDELTSEGQMNLQPGWDGRQTTQQ